MALLANHPLTSTFSGIYILEANGSGPPGKAHPNGIAGTFDLVNGATKITVRDTDVATYGERRSEMVFSHKRDPIGERWYTWDFMVPPDWNFSTGMVIMQIHEAQDAGAPAVAVQFVLMLENNQLVARVPVDVLTPGNSSYRLGNHPFEFGRWYSICFHANWQLTRIGFWELFVDGVPMFRQYGIANAYDYAVGGYLKLGIYNYNKANGWGTKTIYFRDVSVWEGNDGYQAVMGGVPLAPPRMLQP